MSDTTNEESTLFTVHEVAQRLRVDDTTVRRWITNGVLPAITLPHVNKRQSYRIRQSDVDHVLTSTATPAQTDGSSSMLQAE